MLESTELQSGGRVGYTLFASPSQGRTETDRHSRSRLMENLESDIYLKSFFFLLRKEARVPVKNSHIHEKNMRNPVSQDLKQDLLTVRQGR